MRTALILTGLLLTAAPGAQAAHIAGHYGGVPAVQPAPLPWRPQPQYQRPPVAPPAQPYYVAPPPVVVYPPAPSDERPTRRSGPNVCETMRCD